MSSASALPIWLQWLQALSLPAVAAVAAWIAFHQMQTARVKLQLDLYKQRHDIYQAVMKYWVTSATRGSSEEDHAEFLRNTSEAIFLFDKDMLLFLRQITTHAYSVFTARKLLSVKEIEESKRRFLFDSIGDHSSWFIDRHGEMQDRFVKSMNIANIEPFGSSTKRFVFRAWNGLLQTCALIGRWLLVEPRKRIREWVYGGPNP